MNIFKSYTYTWWQMGIFKLALISIGVLVGAYWHEFFSANMTLVAVVAVVTTAYVMYVSLKQ
jgi:hypothetical protein